MADKISKRSIKAAGGAAIGAIAAGAGTIGAAALRANKRLAEKAKEKKNKKKMDKPKKKMGGGMMKKPMGYDKGGPSFNHELDHPHVQGLKKMINKNRKEKSESKIGKIYHSVFGKQKMMTDKEAKKLADRLRTRAIKRTSATEGSFSTGGEAKVRGMGAAIRGGKFQGVF